MLAIITARSAASPWNSYERVEIWIAFFVLQSRLTSPGGTPANRDRAPSDSLRITADWFLNPWKTDVCSLIFRLQHCTRRATKAPAYPRRQHSLGRRWQPQEDTRQQDTESWWGRVTRACPRTPRRQLVRAWSSTTHRQALLTRPVRP